MCYFLVARNLSIVNASEAAGLSSYAGEEEIDSCIDTTLRIARQLCRACIWDPASLKTAGFGQPGS